MIQPGAEHAAASHGADTEGSPAGVFTAADARDVAERLMAADDPTASAAGDVEPDSELAARLAVEHLNDRLRNLPSFVRRALASAERNADRLSDDRLQGLAELIQNADDVAARSMTFAVEPSGASGGRPLLKAVHDGAPLRLRDVVAMAVPWLSMKSEDSSKVGEFGIGLMTLRSLSETVDVHCGHFHVRFGAGQMTYLTEAQDHPTGVGARTVFHIPIQSGEVSAENVDAWLTQWGDAGLLFLSNLVSVALIDPGLPGGSGGPNGEVSSTAGGPGNARVHLGIERGRTEQVDSEASDRQQDGEDARQHEAMTRTVVTENSGAQWAVYARRVPAPQVERHSIKATQSRTAVAVAFPLASAADTTADRSRKAVSSGDGPLVAVEQPVGHRDAEDTERPDDGRGGNDVDTRSPQDEAMHDAGTGMVHVGLPVRAINLPFRIGAALEPLANRRELADSPWNQALLAELSDLWCLACLDAFDRSAADGWRTVPLASELAQGRDLPGQLHEDFASRLLNSARTRFATTLTFSDPNDRAAHAAVALDHMAVEHPDLTGFVGPAEIAELTGGLVMLPESCRDRDGRWRRVVDEIDQIGAPSPRLVGVEEALSLLNAPGRPTALMSALAGVALAHSLDSQLRDRWCVASRGGPKRPCDLIGLKMLTDDGADPIWSTLGMGLRVDEAYAATPAWSRVRAWLADNDWFAAAATSAHAMRRLSDAGTEDLELAKTLTDEQARALRAAIESLDENTRTNLAPGIGRAVRFDAVAHGEDGERTLVSVRPCEAYFNDREPDSWFVAAGRTPGLTWLHRRYNDLLRSPAGRSGGVGASRLFRLLGAETAPRTTPNPVAEHRYQGYPNAVPFAAASPAARAAMRAIDADALLGDTVSPDLDAVLASIASEPSATERRRRATAVIASLSRAWDRMPSEARAVWGHRGWNPRGEIPATWVLSTRGVMWLSNGRGAKRPAVELAIRTAGTVATLGSEPGTFLHHTHDKTGWREVLLALGVRGDPKASDLIDQLRGLRARSQPGASEPLEHADALEAACAVYEALAALVETGSAPNVGDVAHRALVTAFESGAGLVATMHGWRRPSQLLDGPAVFGEFRAFAPAVTGGTRLWQALNIRLPRAADAEQVIRDLAKTKALASEHRIIEIAALRVLADAHKRGVAARGMHFAIARTSAPRDLRKLPVWTGTTWERGRPAFAVSDSRLADALAPHAPVWRPEAELHQFDTLIEPLRLTRVTAADMAVLAGGSEYDEQQTTTFQAAVVNLKADLALNDPFIEQTLSVRWEDLGTYEVAVCSDLRVRPTHRLLSKVPSVPIQAWMSAAESTLYVSEASFAGRADHGGMAVAALFTSANPRHIALPWLDAWTKAADGVLEQAVTIAAREKADKEAQRTAASRQKLEEVQRGAARRGRKQGAAGGRPNGGSGAGSSGASDSSTSPPPAPPRTLVDPSRLWLSDAGTLLDGTKPPASRDKPSKPIKEPALPPEPGGDPPPRKPRRGHMAYTAEEREDVGMALAQHILGSDDSKIIDIRNQRNVGADAVDSLKNFYELKVHSGEIPDRVQLTNAEVQRALSTPGFFLVLIGNVEDGSGTTEVRIISDPLAHLSVAASGSVVFTGVKTAQALHYTFTDTPDSPQSP